ncbi:MAG TPA: DUF1835 domain-containing protein [Bauldia sp.]|nr:DUF1835 domain-containing protein [Bauldia sp.]
MGDLIITNGDTAADLLRQAGRGGTILPWRDVLHEGPIVGGALEACSRRRVSYLTQRFGLPEAEIAEGFAERDGIMRAHAGYDRIELWFEHDLFDQLQLLQVLAFFADAERSDGLVLVQADDFLGRQRADTILTFGERARDITAIDLDIARRAWLDVAAPTPEAAARRAEIAEPRFPFLPPALRRFLEELPAPGNGLGRTEATALDDIHAGEGNPVRLFHDLIHQEEAAFMGDWSFFRLLDDLAFCDVPLIAGLPPPSPADDNTGRFREAALELTMAGEEVLAGEEDHVELSGLDRWWGGTRLAGRNVWRYDRGARRLLPPT